MELTVESSPIPFVKSSGLEILISDIEIGRLIARLPP